VLYLRLCDSWSTRGTALQSRNGEQKRVVDSSTHRCGHRRPLLQPNNHTKRRLVAAAWLGCTAASLHPADRSSCSCHWRRSRAAGSVSRSSSTSSTESSSIIVFGSVLFVARPASRPIPAFQPPVQPTVQANGVRVVITEVVVVVGEDRQRRLVR
jgi:hypothetical protein